MFVKTLGSYWQRSRHPLKHVLRLAQIHLQTATQRVNLCVCPSGCEAAEQKHTVSPSSCRSSICEREVQWKKQCCPRDHGRCLNTTQDQFKLALVSDCRSWSRFWSSLKPRPYSYVVQKSSSPVYLYPELCDTFCNMTVAVSPCDSLNHTHTAYCDWRSHSIMCQSVARLRCAKTAERYDVLFGMKTPGDTLY